jgi:protein TonB
MMQALSLPLTSHSKAVGLSLALHAFVAAWFLVPSSSPQTMPQQIMQVTLVAPPRGVAAAEQKPPPPPQEPPAPVKTQKQSAPQKAKHPMPQASPAKKMQKPVVSSAPAPAAATVSAAQPATTAANAGPAAPLASTQPLYDAAYLRNPAPEYPDRAKRRRMQGTVLLDVAVTASGKAAEVNVAQSSGFTLLDESAQETVSGWTFIPAKRGAELVAARVMVPIEFKLE